MATVVTSRGREVVANRMKGSGTEPLVVAWGTNPSTVTAAVTDVGVFKEAAETRVSGTSSIVTTTTTNDTYQVTGTITSSSGQTIAEVALVDSTTKPFSTTWATVPTTTAGTTGTLNAAYTPANNTYIQTQLGEVMQVTAGTGTTSVTVSRAQNGSTAQTHTNGHAVALGNPPGTSTANATQFLHGDFTGIALLTSDSIAFTVQVKFS
jgi:hypothetical protein